MKYLVVLILFLISCNVSNKSTNIPCTKSSAENIADKIIKRKHYILSHYKKNIVETNDEFIIDYAPKDSLTLGGGARLEISKDNCSVIEKTFFQ